MVAHSFDVQEAVDYGVEEAIMIWNLRFWIITNKANKQHEYSGDDGITRTWSYNTIEAFQKIFPYWKKGTIERNLNRMIEKKVLVKGNFNRIKFEQTKWYAFFDESKFLAPHLIIGHFSKTGNGNLDFGKSKSRNKEVENSETENGNPENGKYITDNNQPDEKPDEKPDTGKKAFFEEKKIWSVEEVNLHLNEVTRIEVAKLDYDIFWLLEKYVPWINKVGAPRDLNEAFPAWAEKFTAKARSKKGNHEKLKNPNALREDFTSPEAIYTRMEYVMSWHPADWKEYFSGRMPEKTVNGWVVKVSDRAALEHEELLKQINIRIEVK